MFLSACLLRWRCADSPGGLSPGLSSRQQTRGLHSDVLRRLPRECLKAAQAMSAVRQGRSEVLELRCRAERPPWFSQKGGFRRGVTCTPPWARTSLGLPGPAGLPPSGPVPPVWFCLWLQGPSLSRGPVCSALNLRSPLLAGPLLCFPRTSRAASAGPTSSLARGREDPALPRAFHWVTRGGARPPSAARWSPCR